MSCSAITKKGTPCINQAKPGKAYCGVHVKLDPSSDPPLATFRVVKRINDLPLPSTKEFRLTLGKKSPSGSVIVTCSQKKHIKFASSYYCPELNLTQLQSFPPVSDVTFTNSLFGRIVSKIEDFDIRTVVNTRVEEAILHVKPQYAYYFEVPEAASEFNLFNKITFRKYIFQWTEGALENAESFLLLRKYLRNGGRVHIPYSQELDSQDPSIRDKLIELYEDPGHFPKIPFLLFVFLVLSPEEYFWSPRTCRY